MLLNLNPILNPNYKDFHRATDEEILVYGGSNAGKSYTIADKLLAQAIWQPDVPRIKIGCIRKTLPALRRSVLDILTTRARAFGFKFDVNHSAWCARCRNLEFVFCSLNNAEDYEKLRSMTDIDFWWINELLELREPDYEEIMRRLRGGASRFAQAISDFNPEDEFSWVNDRFFVRNIGNVRKFHCTIDKNHPDYLRTDRAKRERARLDSYKTYDKNMHRIFRLGKWGRLEGRIFDWGDPVPLPDIAFDEIFYGGDFGYSVDPAALVKVYRKADEVWFQELLYETGLTNIQLGKRMVGMGFTRKERTAWDSAEPKSNQELYDQGLNAYGVPKGPDSVKRSIDLAKSLKCHIVDGSVNLAREHRRYIYVKDKNGRSTGVPIEDNDHAIKAALYALVTFYKPYANLDIYNKSLS